MADEQIVVEEIWKLRDETTGSLRGMTSATRSLGAVAGSARNALLSLGAAVGVTAGIGGVASLIKGVIQARKELENTEFAISGLLYQATQMGVLVSGPRSLVAAGREAKTIYSDLEKYAAKALGTTEEYVSAWQEMMLPVTRVGGGLQELERLTKLIVPTAMQFRVPLAVAARDISQALMGRMTMMDKTTKLLGLESAQLNALWRKDPSAVLALITARMESISEVAGAAGDLFDAKSATLADAWLRLKRDVGGPLFKELKKQMTDLIAWTEAHQDDIAKWAREMGNALRDAFLAVKDATAWIAAHWDGVYGTIKMVVEVWLAGKALKAMLALVKAAVAFKAAMMAGAVASAASGAGGMAGGLVGAARAHPVIAGGIVLAGGATYATYKMGEGDREAAAAREEAAEVHKDALQEARERYLETYQEMVATHGQLVADTLQEQAVAVAVGFNNLWGLQIESLLAVTAAMESQSVVFRKTAADAAKGASAKPVKPVVDMRGSKIEIKVDARHQDPDRVAASIISVMGREAMRRTQAKTAPGLGTMG